MHHPFEKILLATEHTEFDSGSERVAIEMAKRCNLPLSVVVPVVTNPVFEVEAPKLIDRAEHEIAARIEALEQEAKEQGVSLSVHARRGEEPCGEIVDEAKDLSSDLIVIRRRGKRSFLSNLLVGEMVGKVVRHSPCSVLMVPRACSMWKKGVLVALDDSDSAERVLDVAAKVAAQCGIPLHVLSVAHGEKDRDTADRIVEKGVEWASRLGANAHGLVLLGRPCDEILGAQTDADLVVLGMGDGRLGGTAQRVVGQSDIPVLAVHF